MDLNLGSTRALIDECRKQGLLRNQCAYVLATAYHETAHTMKPIYERGGKAYFNKYDAGTAIGKRLGNTVKGDGSLPGPRLRAVDRAPELSSGRLGEQSRRRARPEKGC